MAEWSVAGRFAARRGYWQSFTKQVEANSAEQATERVLSQIGGSHGVGRSGIRIERVEAVPA